jgi:signal transduction histidine kinase/ligand-binding sensor domain-containing protein
MFKGLSINACSSWAGCILFLAATVSRADFAPMSVKDLPSEYVVDHWETEEGLPDNFINDIQASPEGYLWINTFNGLTRFNGLEFTTFDPQNEPQLESRRLVTFALDSKGRLWIESEDGSICCWMEGRFKDYTRKEWPANTGRFIREDSNGELWLGAGWDATNIYHFRGDSFEGLHGDKTFKERFGHVSDINGYGWDVFSNSLCCVDPRNSVVAPIPGSINHGLRLAASRDGGIWLITDHVRKYRDGKWTDFGLSNTDLFNGYFEDRSGNLWVGTDIGQIWRISPAGLFQRFVLPNVKTTQLGRGLCQDGEGNIWLGTGGNGIFRLKPRMFQVYTSEDGLASDLVRSVTQDRSGHVWLATVNSVDCLPSPESKHAEKRDAGAILPWEVLGAKDGALLVGTFAEGLFRLSPDGVISRFTNAVGYPAPIDVVFQEHDGTVDLGTTRGLVLWTNNGITEMAPPKGLEKMDVRAIAQDSLGNLYVGLESGGLLERSSKGWNRFSTNEGLSEDHVRCLWVDRDNMVWIGTQRSGLSRFDGKNFFNYTNSNASAPAFDFPSTITALIGDDQGFLWVASNRGLHRVGLNELAKAAEGQLASVNVIHFDRSDGMGSSECIDDHQPSVWKTSDGKLWFATTYGVSVIDPNALQLNQRPPQVRIEGALIDDRPNWPASRDADHSLNTSLRVPPDYSRLEFRFTALSLTAPLRNRYRFRLAGFENTWEEAGTRRTAYYKRVPPGHYQFRVAACNNDGVWNNEGASLDVIIIPPWWETSGFRWAAAAAMGLAIYGAYHWRVKSLTMRTAAQQEFSRRLIESQEQERQRIAGELHDGLGQSLLVIKSRALLALKDPDLPGPVKDELDSLTNMAGNAIGEARQIAHNLRPVQLDELGLTRTIRGMITNVSRAAGIPIEHELANLDGAFAQDQEITVYRIVQELLNNVMKHARASQARVTLERDAGWVRLSVHDNGRGFNPEISGKGGLGMRTISERVRILTGTWSVQSPPGGGTTVLVDLPIDKSRSKTGTPP